MLKTTVSKQALVKDGCCVIQAGTGSPINNDFILSISWQQADSLDVGIVWQQPHLHLHGCKISQAVDSAGLSLSSLQYSRVFSIGHQHNLQDMFIEIDKFLTEI